MTNWWIDHPWRMIQTNLREIDMLDIDANEYVTWLKTFQANVAMINTSGIIASYKTDLPFHFQSPYLKGDSLEKIIERCHEEGIRVIARTDFSKIRRPLYEQHPEWAYRSAEGKIVNYNGDVHACINGDYQQQIALDIMVETVKTLPVDGIFCNMGGYQVKDYSYNHFGICHCDNCQRLFMDMFHCSLPKKADMADSVYRKYRVFQRITLDRHHEKLQSTLKAVRPGLAINGVDIFRQESNTEYLRELPRWQYSASTNTRTVISSHPGGVSSNSSVDFIGFFYRHVAVNPAEQELRLWQNLANCGGLDYYIIGRLDNHQDRSGYSRVQKVFHYHKKNEKYYQGNRLKADILLIQERGWENTGEDRGWIRFLTEKHYLFDQVLVYGLRNLSLSDYQAVVLTDTKYLSDEDINQIDDYVRGGGVVIASGESALFDSEYEKRDRVTLESLGIAAIQAKRDDMVSALILIDSKDFFPSFEQTDLLYFGDSYLYATYQEGVEQHLKLIPPHNFGPPERCYYQEVTDLPGFTVNSYGQGKGVFIPWYPGQLFYKEGYSNTIDFIADLISSIAGVKALETNLTPMVEITLSHNQREQCDILHLVNTSGHFGNTFYDPIIIHDTFVKLPYAVKPREIISLLDGKPIDHHYEAGMLEMRIDRLDAFEAIKIV